MIFFGQLHNHILKFETPTKVKQYLGSLPDCRVSVVMKRYRKPRTLDQNAYYWKCLEIAADSLGYDQEELHDSFKALFLVDRSKKVPLVRSTAILTTAEFSIYLEKVLRKLAELDIVVMTPEEYFESQTT